MPRAKLEDFVGILVLAEQLLDSLTKAPLTRVVTFLVGR